MPQGAVARRRASRHDARLAEPEISPAAHVVLAGIDLGSCVLVSRLGDWHRDRSQEGVVIEVVAPGAGVRSARVVDYAPGRSSRSVVTRYVVQCWERRVLRRAVELEVVCH